MSCTFGDDLTAYVDDELSEVRAHAVKLHLAGCAECRMVEGMLRRTAQAMGGMPAFEPSPELRRRVMRQLEPQPTLLGSLAKLLRPQLFVPVAGAVAVMGIVLAVRGTSQVTEPALVDAEPGQLELAMNLEELDDFDVAGLESPDDVDVVEHLDELAEVKP